MRPPRHPDHFLRGSLSEIQRDPIGFLTFLHRTYGDVSVHRVGPLDYHLVAHPDGVKRILQDNHPNYSKRIPDPQAIGYLTGPGVLVTVAVAGSPPSAAPASTRCCSPWSASPGTDSPNSPPAPLNASTTITSLTVRIATMILFSLDLDARAREVMECFTQLNALLIRRFRSGRLFRPLPLFRDDRTFLRLLRRFDSIIDSIIAGRRARPADSPDLLAMLMSARDEDDGGFLSDRDLRSEIKTLRLAGFEITSNALSWSLFEFSRRSALAAPFFSRETLARLPQLRSFLDEILRL
ncbi:MAG: cytochrome P450 [Bryobacter sp.]|jgi:hypothetical protein|nr:cytochrome P450 [Bryobacter sp. CoA8 C33]